MINIRIIPVYVNYYSHICRYLIGRNYPMYIIEQNNGFPHHIPLSRFNRTDWIFGIIKRHSEKKNNLVNKYRRKYFILWWNINSTIKFVPGKSYYVEKVPLGTILIRNCPWNWIKYYIRKVPSGTFIITQ